MSGSGITQFGRDWERRHSLWIGWTFTLGFFNWIGFLYAGIRAKKQAWVMWGAFYSIPFTLAMIFADRSDAVMDAVVVPLTLVLGVVSIVHAFRIRAEYLRRIAADQRQAPARASFYPTEQRPVASGQPPHTPQPSSPSAGASPAESAAPTPLTQPEPRRGGTLAAIDLNSAPEQDLAVLPELGPALARLAVEERGSRGGFSSIDEFGEVLGLKPHVLEKLRPRLVVEHSTGPRRAPGPAGRVVDF